MDRRFTRDGSDDLEAFGRNSYGDSYEDEEHSMSIGERYGK